MYVCRKMALPAHDVLSDPRCSSKHSRCLSAQDGCPSILGEGGDLQASLRSVDSLFLFFSCRRAPCPAAGSRPEGCRELPTPRACRPLSVARPGSPRSSREEKGARLRGSESPRQNSQPARRQQRGSSADYTLQGRASATAAGHRDDPARGSWEAGGGGSAGISAGTPWKGRLVRRCAFCGGLRIRGPPRRGPAGLPL